MNKLTTKLLSLSAGLLLFMGLTTNTASAQFYAEVNGTGAAPCLIGDPCNLADAVTEANIAGGTVFVSLPNTGATVTFQEDLEGAARFSSAVPVIMDTFLGTTSGGIDGIIAVEGDIEIDGMAVLTIAENVELRLVGQPGRLELNDGATINGDGAIAFTATGGDHLILLGESTVDCSTPATPNRAFIQNARVDKTNGDVKVVDECGTDDPSDLFITNWLGVEAGELALNDNNLRFTAPAPDPATGPDPGVDIDGGALISGSGTAFIMIGEAIAGGFANTHDDCFEVTGAGNLNMAFDKNTNGGVCIELDEIGAGGFSFNRAGSLFVTDAIQLNGSFLNQSLIGDNPTSGARTEFWALKTITTNLEIEGPGEETYDDGTNFISAPSVGHCETDGVDSGNESGVYFFTDVTVEGDLVMTDTDDFDTDELNDNGNPCVEGLWFLGDEDPDDAAAAKNAGPADHQTFSTIEGDFTSNATNEAVGIYLDNDQGDDSFYHNVAFGGDFIFNLPSPTFILSSPADAFPVGDLCSAYSNEADGNKVLFTGGDNQLLKYPGDLVIPSVQVKKADTNDDVEIEDTSGIFFIDTSLEILRGEFITNGLLDGEGTLTVVINRDDDGTGILEAGGSDRAYASDDPSDGPLKVKYTGNRPHFSGDEIPGDSDGSSEGDEIRLAFLEIFTNNDNAVITLGKDFTIGDDDLDGEGDSKLIITEGILDVGSSVIKLANRLRIEIGDGEISEPDQIGERGGFLFPTEWIPEDDPDGFERAFEVGDDGIDLLYFGTTDRTVGLEWPASDTDVENRDEDEDVIRDVTINNECVDDDDVGIFSPVISLREDDNESRVNGDLIIGGFPFIDSGDRADDGGADDGNLNTGTGLGVLDIVGNVLELNATHGADDDFSPNDTVVEVHEGAMLTDSTDPLLANMARTAELTEAVSIAMAEYRRTLTSEAAAEMQMQIDALRLAQQEVSKTAGHAGLLRFIGEDLTAVWVGTDNGSLRFDFPAIEVDKSGDDGDSRVTLNANGVHSTSTGDVLANNADIIGTSHFTLITAEGGSDDCPDAGCADAGGVDMLDNLDILDIGGGYYQFDGEFRMAGLSSIGAAPIKPYIQTVMVGFRFEPGNMVIEDGEFYAGDPGGAGSGGNVEVFGDFCLGCTPPETSGAASKLAADPQDGVFSLAINGTHTVVGDFTVGPDSDPSEDPLDVDARNRYFLGGECGVLPDRGGLFANGNYHFEGTGDRFDDLSFLQEQQGLHGNVFFTGAVEQFVWHRQDEDAFFCDVIMASRSDDNDGIELLSNAWQNDEGTLTLEHGIIDVGADSSDWIIQNTGFETDLAGRNNSARGTGVVDLGSRDSYINGEMDRRVETGNASGGVITGGYLFPTGVEGEDREDGPVGARNVDFFRPLILQFPDDLGRSSLARVNYVGLGDETGEDANAAKTATTVTRGDVEFPEAGLVVDAVGGGTLTLDVLSNQFWLLEFDRIPSFDPNIRVEADELPNIFDIKSLRLIQWDCDGTNPRLAGLYDLDVGAVDDASAVLNDFIDGVPNLTQEGVDVEACQIIGIASDFLINQINIPEFGSGLARVQLIHNVPDAPAPIDVYINGNRVWNDAVFQTATPFVPVEGGTHTVDVVAGSDADNSNPIFTQELTVVNTENYVVVAHGLFAPGTGEPALKLVVQDGVRLESTDTERIDFFIIHGAPRLGEIDIRELDPVNNNTVIGLLANNVSFDDVGAYLSLETGVGHNIEFTTSDNSAQIDVFRFELQARAGTAAVFNISGLANKASATNTTELTIMGVEADGSVFFPSIITADEPDVAAELPTTFELLGNYPNPFNPSTSISFDLPQTAEVTVEVIDMLGRSVMLLPAKQMEAGASRTVEINASTLASGAYLYRLIAKTATETMVKTGRMMLIK